MCLNLLNLIGSDVHVFLSFLFIYCIVTDKGVSAKQIVVSGKMLDYDDEFSTTMHNEIAIQQLNSILPEDIRVFSCKDKLLAYHEIDVRVSNGFNPHLNSFSRKYLYYLPIDLYHCIF